MSLLLQVINEAAKAKKKEAETAPKTELKTKKKEFKNRIIPDKKDARNLSVEESVQLDESLKQKVASLLFAALMSNVAHGESLKDTVKNMSPESQAAISTGVKAVVNDPLIIKGLQQKATDPKVKQTLGDQQKMQKIADELKALTSDTEEMLSKVKLGK